MSVLETPARAAFAALLLAAFAPPAPARAQAPAPAPASSPERSPTLEAYLAEAEAESPLLHAHRADIHAAEARTAAAGALPDPMVAYEIESDTRDERRNHEIDVTQTFPWWGKRALREEQAEKDAEVWCRHYEEQRLAVAAAVKRAYAEYWFLARDASVAREDLELLRYWESVARTRYGVGAAMHHDVLKAQVEIARTENELRNLEDARPAASAKLAAALGREPEPLLPWPEDLPSVPSAPEADVLLAVLRESNPELRKMAAEVEKEDRAAALARKDYYPDFTLGLGWMHEDPGRTEERQVDQATGMIEFNVPIQRGKYDAAVREAEARKTAAHHHLVDRERMLSADLRMAALGLANARRRIVLYEGGLLPKAEEALVSGFAAYRGGESGFLEVLDAKRTLLELKRELARSRADALAQAAEIEKLTGAPLLPSAAPAPAEKDPS